MLGAESRAQNSNIRGRRRFRGALLSAPGGQPDAGKNLKDLYWVVGQTKDFGGGRFLPERKTNRFPERETARVQTSLFLVGYESERTLSIR